MGVGAVLDERLRVALSYDMGNISKIENTTCVLILISHIPNFPLSSCHSAVKICVIFLCEFLIRIFRGQCTSEMHVIASRVCFAVVRV